MSSLARVNVTNAAFLAVFNQLAVACQAPADDSGITQRTYFEALKDLPPDALEAGALRLMRETGRRFFPTTAEWRDAAVTAQREASRQDVAREPWRVECQACDDCGWVHHTCDGEHGKCGRTRKHQPHDYVTVCGCRATNRTFQRHHAEP